ncbi:MAG: hypothetical protein M0Z85_08775 [Gammaproteobacteria bacterium]|nr:hypothetical protein [Gammaproteobacteria bacterium]MDA8191435.1 hypothetical protein [Gammaproteobacteria bacterium]
MAQETPQNPLTQTELTVTVKGETFVFKIPSIRDEAKVGSIARWLRAQDDPAGIGAPEGLDFETFFFYQALATIQVLLKRASDDSWWSTGPDGRPVLDASKLPESAPVKEVYEGYLAALDTFRGVVPPAEGSTQSASVDRSAGPEG